jgi:hypothetical protein
MPLQRVGAVTRDELNVHPLPEVVDLVGRIRGMSKAYRHAITPTRVL